MQTAFDSMYVNEGAQDGVITQTPYLLTPGPLTTARATRQAMLRDWGSWDGEFRALTASIRTSLLRVAELGPDYECVPLQGSGTYCVEAMLGSLTSPAAKVLVLANGAYGQRMGKILRTMGRSVQVHDTGDCLPPDPAEIDALLRSDASITHVAMVHCETTSGIVNPLEAVGKVVARRGRKFLIDAVSSFGIFPIDPARIPFEAFVSSSNKCIEGVPGFGYVMARKQALQLARGLSPSLSLDLHDQWETMNHTGQWRFTPPTHVLAAFAAALAAYEHEGMSGRRQRYEKNREVLVHGLRELGLQTLLPDAWQSPVIVTFFSPSDVRFSFSHFYDGMRERGFMIYPGKLTRIDTFRIGCIGQIDAEVMRAVVRAVAELLDDMEVADRAPAEVHVRDLWSAFSTAAD